MGSNMCYGVDMSVEQWRTKPEWEGYYEFSNWGGARSVERIVTRKDGKRYSKKAKALTIDKNGNLGLCINNEKIYISVYKIVAELFINDYIEGIPITPIDGDFSNCRLDNLQLGCAGKTTNSLPELYIIDDIVNDIPVIEGGFSANARILCDIVLAKYADKPLVDFREWNIRSNLNKMDKGVDYLDLKEYSNFNDFIPILLHLGYTTQAISKAEHIYIFSERGVPKVMATLRNSNPVKWEFLNNFVNEYFGMREQIKNQQNTLEQQKKDLLFAIYTGGQAGIIASKQLTELEVQEATAPLIKTIEQQAPKIDKFDKYMESDGTYNPTNAAKQLGISSAQKFNSLLKEKKIQYKSGGNYVLYANYQWLKDEGYCKYKEGESNGHPYIQLRWYPKGINWLRDNILAVT